MSIDFPRRCWPLVLFVLCALCALFGLAPGARAAAALPKIERAADLPRFSYPVQGRLEDIVRSPTRFAPLAAAIRRDDESLLTHYDIADKATRRDLVTTLALIAFLDGRYDEAEQRAASLRGLEDKPAARLMAGMRVELMARAARQHGLGSPAYRRAVADSLARALDALPWDVVGNEVREAAQGVDLSSEVMVLGPLREEWQPVADAKGVLSEEIARGLVAARFSLVAVLPLKETLATTYKRYVQVNELIRIDIWSSREVELPASGPFTPVRIAVWDGGVDTSLFPGRVLRGSDGAPAVIAFDKYSRPAQGELMPLPPALRARLPQMKARSKGFSDLELGIESAEAAEVKRFLATLEPARYRAAVEEIEAAGDYEHGTHVAGIALAGNPWARLVVGRMEYSWTLKPDPCPSLEQSQADARAQQATVDFFVRQGVRVVNMSWGGSVADIEGDLEKCGIGSGSDERKALARRYQGIEREALTRAFAGAPGIVFVTAAGNSDTDASFSEDIPAGISLPNLLVVGAVDQAGDEAAFTSYGPTVRVHADGYQVRSVIPGGERIALSGTSMAAPQVANLAAKILALKPALAPTEVIRLIVSTSDASADGRRHLINPKKALAAAGLR